MKSWKTTVSGLLTGGGIAFAQFFPEYARFGLFAAAVGAVISGLVARDNDVTSEQAGANNHTEK